MVLAISSHVVRSPSVLMSGIRWQSHWILGKKVHSEFLTDYSQKNNGEPVTLDDNPPEGLGLSEIIYHMAMEYL